ncbi:hypothetical protein AB0F07_18200 [Streptomyces fructofermentans]|uniref:hypothetical protein n=1 Tax=Streptomyces fructofermentans TaxID=152141 RepID=UPI0033E4A727
MPRPSRVVPRAGTTRRSPVVTALLSLLLALAVTSVGLPADAATSPGTAATAGTAAGTGPATPTATATAADDGPSAGNALVRGPRDVTGERPTPPSAAPASPDRRAAQPPRGATAARRHRAAPAGLASRPHRGGGLPQGESPASGPERPGHPRDPAPHRASGRT